MPNNYTPSGLTHKTMSSKITLNMKTKQTATHFALAIFTLLAMCFGTLIVSPSVAADANICEKRYPLDPTKDTKRQLSLVSACTKGYTTKKCDTIKADKHATKAARKSACQAGSTERKADDKKERCKKKPDAKECKDDKDKEKDDPGSGSTKSCGNVDTTIITCDDTTNGVWGLLLLVINILAAGVGIAAIGGFIYGAILYTTASGNASQVTQAKTTIANTAIGLAAFALMFSFTQYLIPGGFLNAADTLVAVKPAKTPPPMVPKTPSKDSKDKSSKDKDTGGVTIKNFRDASSVTGGKVLKPGVLYRSTQLTGITAANQKKLGALLDNGLIIDLRTADMRRKWPDKKIPGAANISWPIEGFHNTKPAVTDPARRKAFGGVLKRIANHPGDVLIHCRAGKDRTGWLVAMVMYASGATDKQVRAEYAESTKNIPDHDPDWINPGITAAKKNYGSIKGYLKKGLGLSDSDLRKLKNKFGA